MSLSRRSHQNVHIYSLKATNKEHIFQILAFTKVENTNMVRCRYLISIKIRAPLNFAPLNFAPLIFARPQISRPFNFRVPLFYCEFAVFSFIVSFFLLPLIFALSYRANLSPLIFPQARCTKIIGNNFAQCKCAKIDRKKMPRMNEKRHIYSKIRLREN